MLTINIFNVDETVWKERTFPRDVVSQLHLFSPKYFNVPRKEDGTFRSDDVYIRVSTSASSMRPTHFVAPNITRYSIACLRFYGVNRPLARPPRHSADKLALTECRSPRKYSTTKISQLSST